MAEPDLLPCPFCGGPGEYQTDTEEEEFSEEWIGCTSCGATTALEVWNRRSVTSQASEGEEVIGWYVIAADTIGYLFGDKQEAERHGVPQPLYLAASPSKRVEMLETAGTVLLELLDDYMTVSSLTANDRYRAALEELRQALGDRS